MRGQDSRIGSLFSYMDLEQRIRSDHPLRTIRTLVDEALSSLDGHFGEIYSEIGRPSIPPEQLLRAMLLQAFYSLRSERQLMERLDLDLLFRWFVGLGIDEEFQAQGRHAARQPQATPGAGATLTSTSTASPCPTRRTRAPLIPRRGSTARERAGKPSSASRPTP